MQRAPYLPYARLRVLGEAFLAEHHPQDTIPVPIEEIVDQQLKIDIIPMILFPHEIESFTSHDMSTFYVDKNVYDSENTNRLRFSIAHELSHVILHKDILKNAGFTDISGWKDFTLSFGDDYKWIELQAYSLAGILLVPTKHLINEYASVTKQLEAAQIDIRNLGPTEMNRVAGYMAKKFSVSKAVINKRAIKEDLWTNEDIVKD